MDMCGEQKQDLCGGCPRCSNPVSEKLSAIADGQAGVPGFEPRSTAPKAGVLPLHHTPVRAKLYHNFFSFRPE